MQPSSGQQRPLPAVVAAELARLEAEVGQAADLLARARLADLGEAAATRVLRRAWEERHAVRSLSTYINAPGLGLLCGVNAARQEEPTSGDNDVQLEMQSLGQQTPCRLQNEERTTDPVFVFRATPSPQMMALGELEFDRRFLIFVYLGGKKIEEVLDDVNYIRYLKSLPMDSFESEIWNKFGKKSVPAADRRKNLDWDSSKTRLYYCNVEISDDTIVTTFKEKRDAGETTCQHSRSML